MPGRGDPRDQATGFDPADAAQVGRPTGTTRSNPAGAWSRPLRWRVFDLRPFELRHLLPFVLSPPVALRALATRQGLAPLPAGFSRGIPAALRPGSRFHGPKPVAWSRGSPRPAVRSSGPQDASTWPPIPRAKTSLDSRISGLRPFESCARASTRQVLRRVAYVRNRRLHRSAASFGAATVIRTPFGLPSHSLRILDLRRRPALSLPCPCWVRRQPCCCPARRTSRMARCLLRLLALAGAFLAIAPAAQAAQCGLPDAAPWWIDFSDGSVSFRDSVFKHTGVIAASTGAQAPASLRAGGAQTVYWYMHLDAIVGSPAAPARPRTSRPPRRSCWPPPRRRRAARRRSSRSTRWRGRTRRRRGRRAPPPIATTSSRS